MSLMGLLAAHRGSWAVFSEFTNLHNSEIAKRCCMVSAMHLPCQTRYTLGNDRQVSQTLTSGDDWAAQKNRIHRQGARQHPESICQDHGQRSSALCDGGKN